MISNGWSIYGFMDDGTARTRCIMGNGSRMHVIDKHIKRIAWSHSTTGMPVPVSSILRSMKPSTHQDVFCSPVPVRTCINF